MIASLRARGPSELLAALVPPAALDSAPPEERPLGRAALEARVASAAERNSRAGRMRVKPDAGCCAELDEFYRPHTEELSAIIERAGIRVVPQGWPAAL